MILFVGDKFLRKVYEKTRMQQKLGDLGLKSCLHPVVTRNCLELTVSLISSALLIIIYFQPAKVTELENTLKDQNKLHDIVLLFRRYSQAKIILVPPVVPMFLMNRDITSRYDWAHKLEVSISPMQISFSNRQQNFWLSHKFLHSVFKFLFSQCCTFKAETQLLRPFSALKLEDNNGETEIKICEHRLQKLQLKEESADTIEICRLCVERINLE